VPPRTPNLLTLGRVGRPVLDDYLQQVAGGGMGRYRDLVQTGGKAGQTLYSHVLDGVLVLEQLATLLGLDDPTRRCLFAAYTVHDLNKVPPYAGPRQPYNAILTPENVAAEATALGLRAFFPDLDSYLADVVTLARLHQAHQAVPADGLNRKRLAQYRLDPEQLQSMGALIRAADALDLAHGPDPGSHAERFLIELNAASPTRRFQLLSHRLAENRGLLTNLIHNVVVEELVQRAGATPVACYADGVLYVVEASRPLSWGAAEDRAVAGAARARLAAIQREALGAFIRGAPAGIKVDPACFESGASVDDVLAILANRAQAKKYSDDWRAQREADLRSDLGDALPADFHLPDDGRLRQAELLSAYRILLDDHAAALLRRQHTSAWVRAYDLAGLPDATRRTYDRANSFRRAYLLAAHLDGDFDGLLDRIRADARRVFAKDQPGLFGGEAAIPDGDFLDHYLAENLTISGAGAAPRPLAAHLQCYVAAQHHQCCYCSATSPSVELMKLNVPPSVGVQSFSNRLAGGAAREPKRNVCPLCRSQFVLERLAWVSHTDKYGGDLSTFYLHLFPYACFTREQLGAWWAGVSRLRDEETSAFYLDPGTYFRQRRQDPAAVPSVWKTRRNGVAIPQFAEALGNTPTLAIHAPGTSFSEQWLLAMQTAAILARFFGCKALVSRTAVPILDGNAFGALFVDGAPRALRWLVPQDDLDPAALEQLLDRLALLHQLQDAIRQGAGDANLVLELARAAADDPLAVYFVADRRIARGAHNDAASANPGGLAIQRAAPLLRRLLATEGRNPVEYLDQMARVAAQNYLIGSSFKRNSLLDPLDTLLELTEKNPLPEDRAELRAAGVTNIFSRLERLAEADRKPGRTKREEVKRYVNLYVDGLLAQDHHGDVNQLLNRARFIRSAYLFYVQEALDQQRLARKADQNDEARAS
jgi:CRISPR-associated protein Csc3